MSAHNPDNLTPEQIGTADGWRLLDTNENGERFRAQPACRQIEIWMEVEWWMAGVVGGDVASTYRTRLSRSELRKARGLEPEDKVLSQLCEYNKPQGGDEPLPLKTSPTLTSKLNSPGLPNQSEPLNLSPNESGSNAAQESDPSATANASTPRELVDWAESILCNSVPMNHCTQSEWETIIKSWRDAKHRIFPDGTSAMAKASDTPRTDVVAERSPTNTPRWNQLWVDVTLARTLERELSEVKERLSAATNELEEKQKIIETMCKDWSDNDTAIKAICEKAGVVTESTGDYFKDATECVEQMYEKLVAQLAATRAQSAADAEWLTKLREQVEALQVNLEAARADTERLDWLEAHGDAIYGQQYFQSDGDEDGVEITRGCQGATTGSECVNLFGRGPTFRAAIDSAKETQP